MSYKNSNLYASRVFSEHPLALWAIDENFYFYSLIDESAKQINSSEWLIENASIAKVFIAPSENPIEGSALTALFLSASNSASISATSPNISYNSKVDAEKGSVCANSYIYIPATTIVDSVRIGIATEIDGSPGQYTYSYKEYTSLGKDVWEKIEYTKQITSENDIKMFINVTYNENVNNNQASSVLYFSGVSVGQWSEPFNSVDTGTIAIDIPEEISSLIGSSGLLKGVQLDPYGFNDSDIAYAIEYDKRLLAETSGMPMVYGSKNNLSVLYRKGLNYFQNSISGGSASSTYTTSIDGGGPTLEGVPNIIDGGFYNYYNTDENPIIPSIVFPGKGFLNQSGKYLNLTAEFWMRINNESVDQIRIFGPIASEDGIYVGGEFITVKVGKHIKSYFIGQWYRPMLVHLSQSPSEISLMINAEKVISIKIDSLEISTFPNSTQDYLGLYGNEKITPFDIDSFSIFPYIVTEQIAKRRFVYGQGVDGQENISSSFGGDLTYFDFPYSSYNSTISFPDRTPWSSGYSNNLKISKEGISLPDYTLPDLIFSNTSTLLSQAEAAITWSSFEEDNYAIQDELYPFISMVPNSSYNDVDSTIYFSTLNKTNYKTESVYGVLKTGSDVSAEQSILYLSKNATTDYFEVKVDSGSIQYIYSGEILSSSAVSINEEIAAGIDFNLISESYPQTSIFFANTDNITLNFAGNGSNVFLGKIFSLTLNNQFFTDKDNLFNSSGIADKTVQEQMFSYIGSYTLIPKQSNSTIFFDIACSGYWESSVPLSYFGKYINNISNEKVYDLDLVQFNIDIPATVYSKQNTSSEQYNDALKTKTYLTLQEKTDVGMIPYTDYTNIVKIGNDRVIDLNQSENINTTKYEVCDSTVIFPPKENDLDFNDYYIGVHIYITSHGIKTEGLSVKKMSFAGLSYDEGVRHLIKTPTGRSISPVTEIDGVYYNKTKNPIVVENESSTYMYITGDHGVSSIPYGSASIQNGISFLVNETLKDDFYMVGLQMYLMFNEDSQFTEQKIFGKFYSSDIEYSLQINPESDGQRAFIKVLDSFGAEVPGIIFFLNGKKTYNPVVKPLQWNSLVISLQNNKVNLNHIVGNIEFYSGLRVNNVAAFSNISEIASTVFIYNSWEDLSTGDWQDIVSSSWSEVLDEQQLPIVLLSINGEDTFNTYSGISYVVGDDNSIINVNFSNVKVLNDATWSNFDIKPI